MKTAELVELAAGQTARPGSASTMPEDAGMWHLPTAPSPPLAGELTLDQMLLKHVPCGIVIIDCASQRFLDFSDRASADLGYSREEFARLCLADLICSDGPAAHAGDTTERLARSPSATIALHRHKSGAILPTEVVCKPLNWHDRECTLAFWTDVTERLSLQERLTIQERYYRALLASIPMPAWLVGVDGRFMAVNSAYLANIGRTNPDELIGKRFHDVWPAHVAEDLWESNRRVMETGLPHQYERRLILQGSEHIVSVSLSPILSEAEVIGVAGAGHNITDLRKTIEELHERETELRTLAENSPDNVIRFDRNGR
ncbi:PAS domain-containing protein [Bradyrhizobium sp. UFLA05-112]